MASLYLNSFESEIPSFRLCIDHMWFCVFLILFFFKNIGKWEQINGKKKQLFVGELQVVVDQLIALVVERAELVHPQLLQHGLVVPGVEEPHVGLYLEVNLEDLISQVLPLLDLGRAAGWEVGEPLKIKRS